MRLFNSMIVLVTLSTLAGCAAPAVTRGAETAVRAEPRRVSAATATGDMPVLTAEPVSNSRF